GLPGRARPSPRGTADGRGAGRTPSTEACERGHCRLMSRAAPMLETIRDGEGPHPPYLYPDYRSTELRAPKRPLVLLPHTLSEVTGPVFGQESVGELDHYLTRQHTGDTLGA